MALTKVPSNLDAAVSVTQSQSDNSTNVATTAYVDTAISNLSDSAPAALNTLNEIAAALGDDANYAATTTAAIAGKLPLSGGAMTGPITTNSTFDGVDIATRDAILTSTTTTANAALPKAGGTMTGPLTVNVTGSDVDAVTITGDNVTDFDFVANPPEFNLEDTSSTSGTKRARITVNDNQFQISALPDDDSAVSQYLFYGNLNNGNVGIGTTNPLDALHVASAVSTDYRGNLFLEDTTAMAAGVGGQVTFGGKYTAAGDITEWSAIQGTKSTASNDYSGQIEFKTRKQGYALETKMTLTSDGNLGIGTANPSRLQYGSVDPKLHVDQGWVTGSYNLTARFSAGGDENNTGASVLINHSNDRGLLIEAGREIGDTGIAHFGIVNAAGTNTRLMTLKQGGNVGIGTDAPHSTANLHINDASDSRLIIYETGTSPYTSTLELASQAIGTYGATVQYTSGAERLTLENYGRSISAGSNAGSIAFKTKLNNTTPTEVMFINGFTGNVGIGLDSPIDSKLVIVETPATIVGGNAINGSTMKGLKLRTNLNSDESVGVWFGTNGSHWSGISGQRNNAASTWGTDLRFYTHEDAVADLTYARERMRIETNGRLRSSTKQYYLSSTAGRGDHYVHTGGHHGAGTYTLFTMPANVTQSAGLVEIWWIYGTPSAAGYTKYLIAGNKSITTLETSGLNGTGNIPTLAWSGQALRVTNSNGSTYYHVRVTLHEIGNPWNPTWGNLSGIA